MATISFVLKDKKAKGKTIVFFLCRHNGKRIKISVKIQIEPQFWNAKEQRVHLTTKVPNHQEINNALNAIEDRACQIYKDFSSKFGRDLTIDELKCLFDKHLLTDDTIIENKQQLPVFDFFENFIQIKRENKKVNIERIFLYMRTLRLLRDFQYETKELVAFERFDEQFSIKFRRFLEEQMRYAPNTIQSVFKVIRAVLNNAVTKNHNVNKEYKSPDFMPEGEETFSIALTINQVEALFHYDFSKNKKLDRVRDLFIIGCYTGLRFSDFSRLGNEHLQGRFLSIVQEKTKKKNPMPVIIPVLEPVKKIFEKYDYKLPNDISNQKMNEYLKEMAKETNIFNEIVSYKKTVEGKVKSISNPQHEEITTHTARRTYCTMSYKLGVPTQSIMKISGHKTETAFLRYLKVTNEEHAERTLRIWEAYYANAENQMGKTVKLNTKIS